MADIARLPVSKNTFEDLRRQKQIYVDHSDLIFEFARFNRPNFLSRPRCFGKSLLISALDSLFSRGTQHFKGLKIEKLWDNKEQGKTYKVIHLDFSSLAYESPVDFDTKIYEYLYKIATDSHIDMTETKGTYRADTLLKDLVRSAPGDFVLLIDEYDYPLTHSLNNESLFYEFRNYLQGFFGAVKALTGSMRFIFITGVGRFAHASVLSQLNLRDLGYEADFAPLLGYSDEDLHNYFDEYVDNAAKILHLTKDECYKQIRTYYDGYRFHVDQKNTVYNPWSVLNFLSAPKNGFRNFWYETGGAYPTLIARYLESIQNTPLETLQKVRVREDDLNRFYEDYFELPTVSLLYQTGYLSLRLEYDEELAITWLNLCPPNLEVKSALANLYYKRREKIH